MRVVITGGTGFLGRPLIARLKAGGDRVIVLSRHPHGRSGADEEVAWTPDGTAGTWWQALDGADAVVHLAGESIAGRRWSARRKVALVESRVLSTRSVVSALERVARRPGVLVSSSGVDYYADGGDSVLTEDAPPGTGFLSRLCVDWEHEALRAEGLGVRVITMRSGLILARDGGALKPMLLPFRLGVGGPLGSGSQYWPWIDREDWIGSVSHLLRHPSASGPVNVTAPTPVTNRQFSRVLARTLRRPCLFPVPRLALRIAVGEMAEVILASHRAVPDRLLALGYAFAHDDLAGSLTRILR